MLSMNLFDPVGPHFLFVLRFQNIGSPLAQFAEAKKSYYKFTRDWPTNATIAHTNGLGFWDGNSCGQV